MWPQWVHETVAKVSSPFMDEENDIPISLQVATERRVHCLGWGLIEPSQDPAYVPPTTPKKAVSYSVRPAAARVPAGKNRISMTYLAGYCCPMTEDHLLIAVVDDEPSILLALKRLLRSSGFVVCGHICGRQGICVGRAFLAISAPDRNHLILISRTRLNSGSVSAQLSESGISEF